MTHACVSMHGARERLAAPGELVEFRAQGLKPAPRRQLAVFAPAHTPPSYVSWPVLVTVGLQLAGIGAVVVLR